MTELTPEPTPTLAELNQAIAVAASAYIKAKTAPVKTRDAATIAAAKEALDALVALRDLLYP